MNTETHHKHRYSCDNGQCVDCGEYYTAVPAQPRKKDTASQPLEDAYTGFDAASATRKHATYIKSVEII